MKITAFITATHVATKATKFDHLKVVGSRRQIRAAVRRLAAEPNRRDVYLGWNWDGRKAVPFAFRDGKQVRPERRYPWPNQD